MILTKVRRHKRATRLLAILVATFASAVATLSTASAVTTHEAFLRQTVISTATAQLGKPYRWGAAGPRAFDCSGLTLYTFKRIGKYLPHSSSMQYSRSQKIKASSARPGDLVFVYNSRGRIYHVAIYAGYKRWIEAPRPGKRVQIIKAWSNRVKYGRVI